MAFLKKKTLRVIPLGGLLEIGKNITAFEYGDDIFILDCGMAFPEDELLGIDSVIPDFTYLKNNQDKIRGLVLTHGHEDHIGAVAYLLKEIDIPVFGTRLTIGLVRHKLSEHGLAETASLNEVEAGDVISFGALRVEIIHTNHSIADSVAVAIFSPIGTIFHTGDFKIDYTPIDGEPIDLTRLAMLGKNGVLLLMSDSTNVERGGYTMSEKMVGYSFEQAFAGATGRILLATFASNIHRVQQVFDAAVRNNRKVAVCGRSMENVVNTAMELGYLNVPENVYISLDTIKNYPDDQLVIIMTGSQGEPMSALVRSANSDNKKIQIKPNDLVVISASPIPGNEKMVSNLINDLYLKGADVIYNDLMDVHVSGHACQEELKLILKLLKPKYFMPVHGEYRHLIQHGALAVQMGLGMDDVFIMENGNTLEFFCDDDMEVLARRGQSVTAGRVFVDGSGVGDVGNIVLKDRKVLSEDGLFVVSVVIDSASGEMVCQPELLSRGFVYVKESEELMRGALETVTNTVDMPAGRQAIAKKDFNGLKSLIRDGIRDYLYQQTKRRPMILTIVNEI